MTASRETAIFRAERVLYGSPYIPPEWIQGHGLTPVCMLPAVVSPTETSAGVCPYARLMLNHAESLPGSAVIFTTRCDQTRRIAELYNSQRGQSFLMNIPAAWQSPVARDMYRDELNRLGRFLIRAGGDKFSLHRLTPHRRPPSVGAKPSPGEGKNIALFGGPETARIPEFYDLLKANGLKIVLDGTELSGSGRGGIDPKALEANPIKTLTQAYFVDLPDIAKRPNTQFYSRMSQYVKARAVEAIIVRTFPWCDLWTAELPRIRECFQLPVLHYVVDTTSPLSSDKRLNTRLSAFTEMIQ